MYKRQNTNGETLAWVVTDDEGYILGLPPMPSAVNFDTPGAGTCLIWRLAHDGPITGAAVGLNASDIEGCFSLSNPIEVFRNNASGCNANGGELFGGPFTFNSVGDGTPDMIPAGSITSANTNGETLAWVVTDDEGYILGLPPMPSAVNFDTPGAGTCLIWRLAHDGPITGAAVGLNASDIEGCFSLSNPIEVIRNNASGCNANGGELFGGPFEFIVGDGIADNIPEDAITLANAQGTSQWIVTDDQGLILGLPPTFSVVDFDPQGEGVCLVWHLSYIGEISGLTPGLNASDLDGCFSLSNPITVVRTEECGISAGMINTRSGQTSVTICQGDGISDRFIVDVAGDLGSSQLVVTDADGNILLLPEGLSIDLEGAGPGLCFVYNVASNATTTGIEVGGNIADFSGCSDISNSIAVDRITCDPDVCMAPLNVVVSPRSSTSFRVSWDRPTNKVRGFEVRVGFADAPGSFTVIPVRRNNITISAAPGRTIQVQVRTICGTNDVSEFSNIVEYTIGQSSGGRSDLSGAQFGAFTTDITYFEVNPNPASDFINVSLSSEATLSAIEIINSNGQLLRRITLSPGETQHSLQVADLQSGLYMVLVRADGRVIDQERLVIAR